MESPGEDPYVCGMYGQAYTEGLQQGEDSNYYQAIVTLKVRVLEHVTTAATEQVTTNTHTRALAWTNTRPLSVCLSVFVCVCLCVCICLCVCVSLSLSLSLCCYYVVIPSRLLKGTCSMRLIQGRGASGWQWLALDL